MKTGGERVLVLAGGASTRTGDALGPKGLIEVGGVPFLVRQCRALLDLRLSPVVVTGVHHEVYAEALAAAFVAGEAIELTRNPEPERGPFSSLQCALATIAPSDLLPGVFVQPLDVPVPSGEVFASLRDAALRAEAEGVIPTHQGRGGHPVWLSGAIARALLSVPEGPEARLDRQLGFASRVIRVAVEDPEILQNLNTEGAWHAYLDLHAPPRS